jgi:hypothetical protein
MLHSTPSNTEPQQELLKRLFARLQGPREFVATYGFCLKPEELREPPDILTVLGIPDDAISPTCLSKVRMLPVSKVEMTPQWVQPTQGGRHGALHARPGAGAFESARTNGRGADPTTTSKIIPTRH